MVQETEFIKTEDGLDEGLVVYSMGNFLSNQRNEILNMTGTEDGLISRVILKRDSSGKVVIRNAQYIPTWVSRVEKGESFIYEIIPIGVDPIKTSQIYKTDVESLSESLKNTLSVQSDPRITQFDFLE
jgi:poly-gamma-glutamate synthesis protein (capsule biosynthesis protein)